MLGQGPRLVVGTVGEDILMAVLGLAGEETWVAVLGMEDDDIWKTVLGLAGEGILGAVVELAGDEDVWVRLAVENICAAALTEAGDDI